MHSRIKVARQRQVFCRLVIDILRSVHGAYVPVNEPFGSRLETVFIGLCVGLGDLEGKPFSATKIAGYMDTPRTTVIRKLDQLVRWDLIRREGRRYYLQEHWQNSLIGMRSYKRIRRLLDQAAYELSISDTLGHCDD